MDYQRRIIDSLLNAARVFDDYLVLNYNYSDQTETISLADIEAALGSDLSGDSEPDHERNRTLADEIILVGEGFGFVVFL